MQPTIAICPRGDPALAWLFTALGAIRPVCRIAGESPTDIAMRLAGRGPFDPGRTAWLPFAPSGNPWREGLHGAALRLLASDAEAIIVTRPNQLPLLRALPALRKIYFAVDDYSTYGRDWDAQEREILAMADMIGAVSQTLGEALRERQAFDPVRLFVSPNAVPDEWIPARCPSAAAPLPEGLDLPRPLAGVIGRVSSRLRLEWLLQAVEGTPWLNWLFVGDTEESELLKSDAPILARLHAHPRCHFIGPRPYHRLAQFAAALDIGVLPYSERSTNRHGSSMRFFLQLAFGTPMLATPGCQQLDMHAPLIETCPGPEVLVRALNRLRDCHFDDGLRQRRWQAAHDNAWSVRARRLSEVIAA